ncbi:hypothetical protein UlMin_046255 [Ulmus minor]
MFYPQHYLVGLDISDKAIHTTIKLSSSQPNASYFMCLKADFFTRHPTDLFDFIFDYTFFCAIEPEMRSVWAQKMRDILKPNGELMMLMFKLYPYMYELSYHILPVDWKTKNLDTGFWSKRLTKNLHESQSVLVPEHEICPVHISST